MIAIRFAVHYSIQSIENPKIKLGKTLENLKDFFLLGYSFNFISFNNSYNNDYKL